MSKSTGKAMDIISRMPEDFDYTLTNRLPVLSVNVTKLGAAIPSINLPPIVTCRPDAPCAKCVEEGGGCYALRGHWLYPNVRNTVWNNLYAYKTNPKLFFDVIAQQTCMFKFVRWFSSGDIVNMEFFKGMVRVARKNKDVKYLCFTKKYEIVNDYLNAGLRIPSNLKIVFSTWGDFIPENPHNLPMTYVRLNMRGNKEQKLKIKEMNDKIPETAIPCTGKCYACQSCWSLKKGQNIVFKKH